MIVDSSGRSYGDIVTSHDLGVRSTKAARRLWAVHGKGIERTTPAARRQPKGFQRGFAMGVACLVAEFHRAGVDVDRVLGTLDL